MAQSVWFSLAFINRFPNLIPGKGIYPGKGNKSLFLIYIHAEVNTAFRFWNSLFPRSAGAIRIHYQASSGSLQSLAADQRLASPGSDFIGGNQSIVIPDGEGAGQIPVWILNDALPELEEVFLVNITGVELVNASGAGNTLPRLGSALVTQVKISANDGTRGVLQFDQAKCVLLLMSILPSPRKHSDILNALSTQKKCF